jgi:solute carrier family 35, member C2
VVSVDVRTQMAGWFFFSSVLGPFNKLVFGVDHLPTLLLTSIHFLTQWMVSAAACAWFPVHVGRGRLDTMPWTEWICVSIPCGLVTSGEIGLSNLSMVPLSLAFYTMIKASTPIFVLFWAYVFGIERVTWPLIGVVLVVATGEFLTVLGETEFDWRGLCLCLTASVLSGARWTMVQLKVHTMDPPLKTPIAIMRLLAPSMFCSLLLVSLVWEEPWVPLARYTAVKNVTVVCFGLLGGLLSTCMMLCEFYLIMHANAIILMIGGVVKEVIAIFLGVSIFHDKLNRINVMGCFIVLSGVLLYKIIFHYDKQQNARSVSSPVRPSRYQPVESERDDRTDRNETGGIHLT